MINEVLIHRLPMVKTVLFLERGINIQLGGCETSPLAEYVIDQEGGPDHLIRVNPEADPILANFYAWHEFGHALQSERLGAAGMYNQRLEELRAVGLPEDFQPMNGRLEDEEKYNSMPLEAEANHIASKYADLYQVLI